MRLCLDCGAPVYKKTGARCKTHKAQRQARRDQKRGNTTARGYGAPHQAHRREAIRNFKPGQPCAHCGRPLHPGQPLDDGHTTDRTAYLGLAHARCNRADGATIANNRRRNAS